MFELFGFVDDSEGHNEHGIGLGLVIAKSLVEWFGGKMMFKSEENNGSVF